MSSDYTPTTEQVRERYILPAHRINHEERGEEFDRWLAVQIREARVEALRDAAESADFEVGYSLQRWLKDRAKREEKAS